MNNEKCIKCNYNASVILRRKDLYCQNCFMANVTHKFRSSLGKNKLMKTCERVLITLSGGSSSIVMLDMIYNAINLESHKKLQVEPLCLHVLGTNGATLSIDDVVEPAKAILTKCEQYNIPVYIIYPSVVDSQNDITPNKLPNIDNVTMQTYNSGFNKITSTARNDYTSILRREIFVNIAKKLNCSYIFTGETDVTVATKMLSGIIIGRGEQLDNDVGFCDSRNEVKILRPMRDITFEEIKHYVIFKNIDIKDVTWNKDKSLQSAIKSFVVDLQNNFQSTVSTVCKTADKIGRQPGNKLLLTCELCSICQSPVQLEDSKLSALDATNFSRLISRNPQTFSDNENIKNSQDLKELMFPSIGDILCYGCSRTQSEFPDSKIPSI